MTVGLQPEDVETRSKGQWMTSNTYRLTDPAVERLAEQLVPAMRNFDAKYAPGMAGNPVHLQLDGNFSFGIGTEDDRAMKKNMRGGGEVIESKRWRNTTTGQTASPYGAVPWTGGRGDTEADWVMENVGWTIRWDDGTVGTGPVPDKTREEAKARLQRIMGLRRGHSPNAADFGKMKRGMTAPGDYIVYHLGGDTFGLGRKGHGARWDWVSSSPTKGVAADFVGAVAVLTGAADDARKEGNQAPNVYATVDGDLHQLGTIVGGRFRGGGYDTIDDVARYLEEQASLNPNAAAGHNWVAEMVQADGGRMVSDPVQ
jgi:hypothetical protein